MRHRERLLQTRCCLQAAGSVSQSLHLYCPQLSMHGAGRTGPAEAGEAMRQIACSLTRLPPRLQRQMRVRGGKLSCWQSHTQARVQTWAQALVQPQ